MDSTNPLAKKVDKILHSDIDLDTYQALKNVSDLVPDNTLATRRNLRANIETQSLAINEQFAKEFNGVHREFQKLCDFITFIEVSCRNMMSKIEELRFQTSDFSHQAQAINSELQEVNDNEKTLARFVEEFTLKPEELMIIGAGGNAGSDFKVDGHFFGVLQKIRTIHERAKIRLAGNQLMTGFEIMDQMSRFEEMAYEKLYRWTIGILRTVNLDFIELHSHLFESLAYLQKKEVLFGHCMDEYTIVRRSAVTHAFIEALTRGRTSNNTHYQAMELYSGDIVRYIRDMLAFLHQTFVFERDMLKTLLKSCDQTELADRNVIKNLISSLTDGVIRILKIRVENCLLNDQQRSVVDQQQVLTQVKRIKNFFLVKNIINFYLQTFGQMFTEDCAFVHFIRELLVTADKVCYNSLKFHCGQLCQTRQSSNDSNIASKHLKELTPYTSLINELLDSIKSSMSFSQQEQQLETERILSSIMDSAMQYIMVSSARFPSPEMTIFNLNCFGTLKKTVERHRFTEPVLKSLADQIAEAEEILVDEQFQFIINSLQMTPFYNAMIQNVTTNANVALASFSGCDPIAAGTFLNAWDKFVSNPGPLKMKKLAEISDTASRNRIWTESLQKIVNAYEKIYHLLVDPGNRYTDVIQFINHKPEDVKKLLLNQQDIKPL